MTLIIMISIRSLFGQKCSYDELMNSLNHTEDFIRKWIDLVKVWLFLALMHRICSAESIEKLHEFFDKTYVERYVENPSDILDII